MVEYTGGDWYLEEETGLILSLPEGSDCPVSVAGVGGNQEPLTPKPLGETEANARLIAQSPKLYEACKEAISLIKPYTEGYGKLNLANQAYNKLKQALAPVEEK